MVESTLLLVGELAGTIDVPSTGHGSQNHTVLELLASNSEGGKDFEVTHDDDVG